MPMPVEKGTASGILNMVLEAIVDDVDLITTMVGEDRAALVLVQDRHYTILILDEEETHFLEENVQLHGKLAKLRKELDRLRAEYADTIARLRDPVEEFRKSVDAVLCRLRAEVPQ